MKVLVTGSAGFIGAAVSKKLLERGDEVIGVDNHNSYYSPELKEARLSGYSHFLNYTHIRLDIENKNDIDTLFKKHNFDCVVNLAAQAGVRYSLENPLAYINTNIVGFTHILDGCRHNDIKHFVYASSSSVYGSNTKMPFSIHDNVDHPVSIYAATKKANELLAHTYSHLYGLPTTGLRFFTVYGPWDRPDMALQKFANSIMTGKKIQVYNYGNHLRDFTYIDDIVEGVIRVLDKPAISNMSWDGDNPDSGTSKSPWRIYNIGSHAPVKLMAYIELLEQALERETEKELMPLQPGDVIGTFADIDDLIKDFDYKPQISIQEGIKNFAEWFKYYYKF